MLHSTTNCLIHYVYKRRPCRPDMTLDLCEQLDKNKLTEGNIHATFLLFVFFFLFVSDRPIPGSVDSVGILTVEAVAPSWIQKHKQQ